MKTNDLDAVRAVAGLADAIGTLARKRDALEALIENDTATDLERAMAVDLNRACLHLVEAVRDIPEAFWSAMTHESHAGVEEVRARFDETLRLAAA